MPIDRSIKYRIYKITCSCCSNIYVDKTDLTLPMMMSDHRRKYESRDGGLYLHARIVGFSKFKAELLDNCWSYDSAIYKLEQWRTKLDADNHEFIDNSDDIKEEHMDIADTNPNIWYCIYCGVSILEFNREAHNTSTYHKRNTENTIADMRSSMIS